MYFFMRHNYITSKCYYSNMADWKKILSRGNVEDRRALAPAAVGGLGLTGLVLYLLVSYLTNGEVNIPLDQLQTITTENQQTVNTGEFEGEDFYEVFTSTVLGSNNDMWAEVFNKENRTYVEPKLVLFRDATESGCGVADSSVGPHYCSSDQTIYLDEIFFDELTRLNGSGVGDVAQAYVISHEVGHHAQNLLGILGAADEEIQQNQDSANDMSIGLELQADCFAGLWAGSLKDQNVLLPGEISEAMDAAAAVGDDRIQETVTGRISPESWTHGSSEQRVSWFTKGYETGTLSSCDAFN